MLADIEQEKKKSFLVPRSSWITSLYDLGDIYDYFNNLTDVDHFTVGVPGDRSIDGGLYVEGDLENSDEYLKAAKIEGEEKKIYFTQDGIPHLIKSGPYKVYTGEKQVKGHVHFSKTIKGYESLLPID